MGIKKLSKLAHFTDIPNAGNDAMTPIHWAAINGHTEIIKSLVPLTENPNVPNFNGETPIHWAVYNGHTEIVKILVPFTDNPNAPNNNGETPIHYAASNGHTKIVKILVPLTDNPNAPERCHYGQKMFAVFGPVGRFWQ